MEAFLQDFRFGLRQIVKNPGFALAAVVTLALGIGTNTAIFSMVRAVLLRPLPYANGGHLVHIGYREPAPDVSDVFFSAQEMKDYRRQSRTLASVEEYHSMTFTLLSKGEPDRVRTGVVSSSFFDSFGVKPLLGRSFHPDEGGMGAAPVLLLSYPYWRRHYAADPGVVGKSVILDGKSVTVVGVLPPIPLFPDENDVFVPPAACSVRSSEYAETNRKARMLSLFGRLAPGATAEQARSEIATLVGGWRRDNPELYPEERYHDIPVVPVQEELTGHFRPTLLILLATVGLVLLLACLNVANLTLSRMRNREREVALRSALGAGRGRLIAQLLTESTILSLLGGALGVVLAFSGLRLLTAFAGQFTARASEITIDGPVLLFTLLVSVSTGLLFGLFPAFQASARNAAATLKAGGRSTVSLGGRRFRSLLTISQVAISFMLLIGAGLAVRSFLKLREVDPGFDLDNVATMTLTLSSVYSGTPGIIAFYAPLVERLQAVPGVAAVGLASDLPLEDDGFSPLFEIEGRTLPEGEEARANFDIASEGFFKAMGIPLVKGRTFAPSDTRDAPPVIVINESFARRYWPQQDPIGRGIILKYRGAGDRALTIVGVVRDVKQLKLNVETGPAFYLPFRQVIGPEMRLFVRTAGDPLRVVPAIVRLIHERDPQIPVTDVRTMAQVRDKSLAPVSLTALLLALFAALAATIAVLGISGVVASSVAERTHEIGIRSALGAGRSSLLGTILWQGMTPVVIGLLLGVAGALALTRFLASILFGVVPNDLLTYIAVAALLLAASALACLVPARHAMKIDPLLALRYE
jgi:putative ABC transport system permease protein